MSRRRGLQPPPPPQLLPRARAALAAAASRPRCRCRGRRRPPCVPSTRKKMGRVWRSQSAARQAYGPCPRMRAEKGKRMVAASTRLQCRRRPAPLTVSPPALPAPPACTNTARARPSSGACATCPRDVSVFVRHGGDEDGGVGPGSEEEVKPAAAAASSPPPAPTTLPPARCSSSPGTS